MLCIITNVFWMVTLCLVLSPKTSFCQMMIEGRKPVISQSFTLIRNLIVIRLFLNDNGPFNFILDTGVGHTLITDPGLAKLLKLRFEKTIKVTGLGRAEPLSAHVVNGLAIRMGRIKGKVAAAVLEEDVFGLSSFTGIAIHGIIGYDIFSSFTVGINYQQQKLRFFVPSYSYKLKKYESLKLSVEQYKPYIKTDITDSYGTNIPVKLIVDTGAGHPLFLESTTALCFRLPEVKIRALLGVGLTGNINGYIGRVKQFRFGNKVLKEVLTSYPDSLGEGRPVFSVARNGNVGNGILSRFNIIIDYMREVLYYKANGRINDRFEHNMSGLELYWEENGHRSLRVSHVEEHSSAAASGIEPDDILLDLDLKPVSTLSIDELNRLFERKPGTSFLMTLYRPSTRRIMIVILTLKRRI